MRSLARFERRTWVEPRAASCPFWSPDSRAIGFFADGQLKTVDVVSGATRTICQVPDSGTGRGGSWNADDTIVFASGSGGGPILRVSASGGNPTPVTTLDEQAREWRHSFPVFLPGGQGFLFTADSDRSQSRRLYAGALSGGAPKFIANIEASNAVYASGHLLFAGPNATLLAQPFDASQRACATLGWCGWIGRERI